MTRPALPYYYINIHALQTVLNLNKKYLSDVQIPRIKLPILSISYLNGVPSAKHVWSYGRAGRVVCISLLFYTPCAYCIIYNLQALPQTIRTEYSIIKPCIVYTTKPENCGIGRRHKAIFKYNWCCYKANGFTGNV